MRYIFIGIARIQGIPIRVVRSGTELVARIKSMNKQNAYVATGLTGGGSGCVDDGAGDEMLLMLMLSVTPGAMPYQS